ncbi:MAG: hypothetical protein U9N46_07815 [Euryarchaeota archaeon]|nr:hypothetical protein [Euryarchaeota archaeon]
MGERCNYVYNDLYIIQNGTVDYLATPENPIQKTWVDHCKHLFPREFAINGKRLNKSLSTHATSSDQLIKLIEQFWNRGSLYVSVYPYRCIADDTDNIEILAGIVDAKTSRLIDYGDAILDTVYIDLDSADLEVACRDASVLCHGLERENIHTRQYFTGSKGFAIYLDFESVQIDPVIFSGVLRSFLSRIEKEYRLTTIDYHTTDGASRVSRIVNTLHHKSGRFCVPVAMADIDAGIKHILSIAQQPRLDIDIGVWIRQNTTANTTLPSIISKLADRVNEDREKSRYLAVLQKERDIIQPPRAGGKTKDERITNKQIDTLKRTGTLSHSQRVGLVWNLDDLGWTIDQIVALLTRYLVGADEGKTREQVESVLLSKRGKKQSAKSKIGT